MSDIEPNIEGVWTMIRGELAGESAPAMVTQLTAFEFAAGAYRVRFGCELVEYGDYELGSSSAGSEMTLRCENGLRAGRTIPCLYQLTGHRLKICFGLDGRMPSGFTYGMPSANYIVMLERLTSK